MSDKYRDPHRLNYDPNFAHSMAKKTVRVTLGSWDYRKVIDVTIGGNTIGLSVIESACRSIWEDLPVVGSDVFPEEGGIAQLVMTRPSEDGSGEDTLIIDDEDERGEDWIADMVLAAEIVSIVPEERPRKGKWVAPVIHDEDESEGE